MALFDLPARPPPRERERRPVRLSTVLFLFLVGAVMGSAFSQEVREGTPRPSGKVGGYTGPLSCASSNCHGSPRPRSVFDVRQNEYFTWSKQDRHSRAYQSLTTEKSRLIAKNLRLSERPERSQRCLACHALSVERRERAQPLDVARGVSCESCHGPASGWIDRHTEESWTTEMLAKAGMKDLRSLTTRARVCLDCHLGSGQKSVDHELIAAGHPHLVFELDNYTEAMPRHWASFRQRKNKTGGDEAEGLRAWAIGQAVSFHAGLLQLAWRARSSEWPEFAEMDCYGCHHSLKEKSWRQERAFSSRPQWSLARYAVLRHLIEIFAPEEQATLTRGVDALAQSIAALNTPGEFVASNASRLAAAMDKVIPRIAGASMDMDFARRLVARIARDTSTLLRADLHSSVQAVMAMSTLTSIMSQMDPSLPARRIETVRDSLYREVEAPETFDPRRLSARMAELERLVVGQAKQAK